MNVDFDLPCKTRDGYEVRIYTIDGGDPEFPVIGERLEPTGKWKLFKSPLNGRAWNETDDSDIVNFQQEHTVWINLYNDKICGWAHSKREADKVATRSRLACIEVTFTEGEGLDFAADEEVTA